MRRVPQILLVFALAAPTALHANTVTYKGNVHHSLGASSLTLIADSLRIAPLGPSGLDGVTIELPVAGKFHMVMAQRHIPLNGSMSFAGLAGLDTISSGMVVPAADSMELSVAFKDVPGITHYRVNAYLDDLLVRSRDVPVGSLPLAGGGDPAQTDVCIGCFLKKVGRWLGDHASLTHDSIDIPIANGEIISVPVYGVDFKFETPGRITGDAVAIVFDNLVIYPIGATVDISPATRLNVTAKNHPPIMIEQDLWCEQYLRVRRVPGRRD